jgi:small-conductance mechanosensitive channel
VGWLIAKLIKRIFIRLLKLVKLNYLTEKSGIEKFLKEGGLKITAIDLIGSLIYWIIMLIVIMSALNVLQLTSGEYLFAQIIMYIPNIIVSIIVLLLGLYAAKFVSQAISVSLTNMNENLGQLIGKISYYAIVVLTVFIVLSQLNIAENIVTIAFLLVFGSFCLAFGLAFGLGGKDYAADLIKKLKDKGNK